MTDLPIPLDAFEGHAALLGTTGSGKSTLLRAALAALHRAGRRIGSIDKMGNQWGLTLARDGKSPGLDVLIFGGRRAHIPMLPSDGERLGRLWIERDVAAIFDISQWKAAEQQEFVAAFADAVFAANYERTPVHLALDEIQSWVPQQGNAGDAKESVERLATQGRGNGIHLLMAAQRPSNVSKTVLNMASTVVAMRTTGPLDRRAIGDIMGVERREADAFGRELAQLSTGKGFVWRSGSDERPWYGFPIGDTFDSSRTPKHGEIGTAPPAASSKMIDELRALLADAAPTAAANAPEAKAPKYPDMRPQYFAAMRSIRAIRDENARLQAALNDARTALDTAQGSAISQGELLAAIGDDDVDGERVSRAAPPVHREDRAPRGGQEGPERRHQGRLRRGKGDGVRHQDDARDRAPPSDGEGRKAGGRSAARHLQDGAGAGGLNSTARLILDILVAVYPADLTWAQATTLAGRKIGNGNWYQARNALRASGRIVETGDRVAHVAYDGALGRDFNDALDMWKSVMPPASVKMIDALMTEDVATLSRPELAAAIGVSTHTNGYFYGGIKHLKDAGVAVEVDGRIALASPLPGESA